jgi:nucleotide-binding universal stress UspA family protein
MLIGNTTRRLVDELNCDVLVIKPPGFRTPVSLPEP